jgi:hypothetical protein
VYKVKEAWGSTYSFVLYFLLFLFFLGSASAFAVQGDSIIGLDNDAARERIESNCQENIKSKADVMESNINNSSNGIKRPFLSEGPAIPVIPEDVAQRYEIALMINRISGRPANMDELDQYADLLKKGRSLADIKKIIKSKEKKGKGQIKKIKKTFVQKGKKGRRFDKNEGNDIIFEGNDITSVKSKSQKKSGPSSDSFNGSLKKVIDKSSDENRKDQTGWFRVITQNVKALPLMSAEKVRHDIELTASQAGIIGWQEIGPAYYKNILKSLPKDEWRTFWGKGHADDRQFDCPISWKKKYWKFIDGGSWELHPPHAMISVRRSYCWAILENRNKGCRLLVTNKHYVAGAWNDKAKPFKELRPKLWREGMKKEVAWLERFMKKYPEMPVILLGDYNANVVRDKKEFPTYISGRKLLYQMPHGSIDLIILLNGKGSGSWRCEVRKKVGETLRGRNSDHQARRCIFQLKKDS